MQKEYKKPAVDLTDLAIGIVVLGIVVAIGGLLLTSVRDNRLTDSTVVTTTRETITASDAPQDLTNGWFNAISNITNVTDDSAIIGSGNYSVTTSVGGIGQVDFLGTSEANGTTVNVTYTWYNTSSRVDWGLADNATTGIAEYGNWFDIIVIVGVAAVILSLIFMAFGRRSGVESGVSY